MLSLNQSWGERSRLWRLQLKHNAKSSQSSGTGNGSRTDRIRTADVLRAIETAADETQVLTAQLLRTVEQMKESSHE